MDFKLRPWDIKDLDSVFSHSKNPKIQNQMSDSFPNTKEKWATFIDAAINDPSRIYRVIDINGEAVGSIGIMMQKDVYRRNAELGYWLSEAYWGKGIVTRAIEKLVDTAFENPNIYRIFAAPFGSNIASQRVLEKSGFILEARFIKTVIKNGELNDQLIYAIRKGQP